MRDFAFAHTSSEILPKSNRLTYAIVAALHLLLLAILIYGRTQPTRLSSAGSASGSIAVYTSGSVGGPAAASAKPVQLKKRVSTAPMPAKAVQPQEMQSQDAQSGSGSAGVADAGQGGAGPVRLGSGGNLTLLKRVQPVYPQLMQSARIPGAVVLDAVIHQDGTIGQVTVVRATNDAFAQSAIAAVKQWRYAPLGFEGLLTVNVTFTLPG